MESIVQLLRHAIIQLTQSAIAPVQAVILELLLHVQWEALLDVCGHVVPVGSVAIAHREEVQAQLLKHVRHEDVRVLVLLVWVAWLMTHGRREGKLRNTIKSLRRSFDALSVSLSWSLTRAVLLARLSLRRPVALLLILSLILALQSLKLLLSTLVIELVLGQGL